MKPAILLSVLLLAACTPGTEPPAADGAPPPAGPVSPVADAVPDTAAAPAQAPDAAGGEDPARVAEVDQTIDRVLGDHAVYRRALEQLQAAVRADDRAAVAGLVQYPLEVSIHGKAQTLPDAVAFVGAYDSVMVEEVRRTILDQRYGELMASWKGLMLGDGQVWINGSCAQADCADPAPRIVRLQTTADPAAAPAK